MCDILCALNCKDFVPAAHNFRTPILTLHEI